MSNTTGVILLAAGASTRMGRPKQLMLYQGKSLLRHAAMAACESECRPVVVVLGAAIALCRLELAALATSQVENPHWQAGMGTSIRVGMDHLLEIEPQIGGAVLMLCDQPLVGAEEINRLLEEHRRTKSEMVATKYPDSMGVPAYFDRSIFPELQELPDNAGCKQILNADPERTATLQIPGALFDVDTLEDYQKLQQ